MVIRTIAAYWRLLYSSQGYWVGVNMGYCVVVRTARCLSWQLSSIQDSYMLVWATVW